VTATAIHLQHIAAGTIVAPWEQFGTLGMLRQLGVRLASCEVPCRRLVLKPSGAGREAHPRKVLVACSTASG
jgi:hypothetical protein